MTRIIYKTTTQAAEQLNRSPGRIRQICCDHGIGEQRAGSVRLLTPADMRRLVALLAELQKTRRGPGPSKLLGK